MKVVPGTSVFPLSETDMLGDFWGRIKGAKYRFAFHGVAKSWTGLSDFTFTFHLHALEKEMATHSSVLA